jgi:GntP family gluconate:H+ symporter
VQEAILNAGTIVLITAAGGAFGAVLRQSGIADAIQQRFPIGSGELSLLLAAFLITAVVRVAQGSATVAMITAVGIVAPLVQTIELPYHPVYVALAIGCGSKPIPWMNDSGFWVVTRMSGMTEAESLRTYTVMLTLMGLVGLAATLAGAVLVPLT